MEKNTENEMETGIVYGLYELQSKLLVSPL